MGAEVVVGDAVFFMIAINEVGGEQFAKGNSSRNSKLLWRCFAVGVIWLEDRRYIRKRNGP